MVVAQAGVGVDKGLDGRTVRNRGPKGRKKREFEGKILSKNQYFTSENPLKMTIILVFYYFHEYFTGLSLSFYPAFKKIPVFLEP